MKRSFSKLVLLNLSKSHTKRFCPEALCKYQSKFRARLARNDAFASFFCEFRGSLVKPEGGTYCGGPWISGTFTGQKECLFLVPWKVSRMMSI